MNVVKVFISGLILIHSNFVFAEEVKSVDEILQGLDTNKVDRVEKKDWFEEMKTLTSQLEKEQEEPVPQLKDWFSDIKTDESSSDSKNLKRVVRQAYEIEEEIRSLKIQLELQIARYEWVRLIKQDADILKLLKIDDKTIGTDSDGEKIILDALNNIKDIKLLMKIYSIFRISKTSVLDFTSDQFSEKGLKSISPDILILCGEISVIEHFVLSKIKESKN